MKCNHDYTYGGVRFAYGKYNRPGSGSVSRYYAHYYFCKHCLAETYKRIEEITEGSYFQIQFGATPGDLDKIVPENDR